MLGALSSPPPSHVCVKECCVCVKKRKFASECSLVGHSLDGGNPSKRAMYSSKAKLLCGGVRMRVVGSPGLGSYMEREGTVGLMGTKLARVASAILVIDRAAGLARPELPIRLPSHSMTTACPTRDYTFKRRVDLSGRSVPA